MSDSFLYIFGPVSFFVFLITAYFSAAWANVRKVNSKAKQKPKRTETVKLIFANAKSQFKTLKVLDWLGIVLSTAAATATVVDAVLMGIGTIFAVKVAVSMLALQSAAIVDWKTRTIPNIICIYLIVARFVFIPFEYVYKKDEFKILIISSVIGLAAIFIVLYMLNRITKNGFGMGDVKLLSSLGFMTGISCCLTTILFGMILAAVLGLILILMKRKTKKDTVPFGPFIFMGFIISVIIGVF